MIHYTAHCLIFSLCLSGWLSSSDDPLGYVDRIDRRIEDLTGLDMSTAEQLQVSMCSDFMYFIGNNIGIMFYFALKQYLQW